MHKIDEISELCDDIAVRDLYLIIAVLSGTMTMDRTIIVSGSHAEYFKERIEIAKRVAAMEDENEEEIWGPMRRSIGESK